MMMKKRLPEMEGGCLSTVKTIFHLNHEEDQIGTSHLGVNAMSKMPPKIKNVERIYRMVFGSVYPMYIQKAEKKGRTKDEVDEIIFWLTGYDRKSLNQQISNGSDCQTFFVQAPKFNPNASKITGLICGYRVEEIEDDIIQKVRYLDKLIDELARGKAMEKILRK